PSSAHFMGGNAEEGNGSGLRLPDARASGNHRAPAPRANSLGDDAILARANERAMDAGLKPVLAGSPLKRAEDVGGNSADGGGTHTTAEAVAYERASPLKRAEQPDAEQPDAGQDASRI